MKLFFDARFIRTDYHDSISLYSASLAQAILTHHQNITFLIHDEKQKTFLPNGAKTIKIHRPEHIKELFSGRILSKYHPDVVWTPLQTLKRHKNYKLILTIHDLTYFKYNIPPKNHPLPVKIGWKLFHLSPKPQAFLLKKADAITVPSQNTKNELAKRMTINQRKIFVAAPAPRSLTKYQKPPKQQASAPKNIVVIGTDQKWKNLDVIVAGMQFLTGRTLHILTKMSAESKARHQKLNKNHIKIVYHGAFDEKKEAEVLANNAILVSASLAEGFGMPLAEAMDFSVPIVVSDTPIFHEVAGEAGTYFDPKSSQSFAKAIKSLDNKKKREEMVKKGLEQVKKFDWNDSAQKIIKTARTLHEKKV
ncbi:MAG: glycosyltransferase family 4 protein [Candidatus Nomurabacteria bacterium]|jgi:glycosyltransferase involved in cell wall biosynthesis|nr:glycosyltransferase family 4 protein [Candidatus Nomurabacteria bacterium]